MRLFEYILHFFSKFVPDNTILILEFVLSIFLLSVICFMLLKKNYINNYSLFFLNLFILVTFLTLFFQDYLLFKKNPGVFFNFLDYTPHRMYNMLINYLHAYINFVHRNNPVYVETAVFYNNNLIFNHFIYYVKLFSVCVFILCLIIGYYQSKTVKISYEKFVYMLFPLLLSTLILICTQDLIIGYLSIEFQNLCLIFLMNLKKNNRFTLQLSVRFFILNIIGSLFILVGIVLFYTIFVTTNLSHIYVLLQTAPEFYLDSISLELLLGLLFLSIGFFFKLLVGPFGLWLVEIYEYGLSYGVLTFSILPKIGYFIFLFHIFLSTSYFLFFWDFIFKFFGILSVLIGTFGALSQIHFKRLLAFSSLNYFGYILLSFVGFNTKSLIICILYFFVYVFVSFYIWFIVLYLEKVLKRNIILIDLVVIRDHYPALAFILSLSLLFLSGLPPFYLFFLKFTTFYILISTYTNILLLVLFLICSGVSLYYYIKLIKIIHFNPIVPNNLKMYELSSLSLLLIALYAIIILSPYFFIIAKGVYFLFVKILNKYFSKIISMKSFPKLLISYNNVVSNTFNIKNSFKFQFKTSHTFFGKTYNVLGFIKNISLTNTNFFLKNEILNLAKIVNKFNEYTKNLYNFDLKNKFSSKILNKDIFYNKLFLKELRVFYVNSKSFFNKSLIEVFFLNKKVNISNDVLYNKMINKRILQNSRIVFEKILDKCISNKLFFFIFKKTSFFKKNCGFIYKKYNKPLFTVYLEKSLEKFFKNKLKFYKNKIVENKLFKIYDLLLFRMRETFSDTLYRAYVLEKEKTKKIPNLLNKIKILLINEQVKIIMSIRKKELKFDDNPFIKNRLDLIVESLLGNEEYLKILQNLSEEDRKIIKKKIKEILNIKKSYWELIFESVFEFNNNLSEEEKIKLETNILKSSIKILLNNISLFDSLKNLQNLSEEDREILNKKLNEILNENLSFEVDFFSTLSEEEKTKLETNILKSSIKFLLNNISLFDSLKNLQNLSEEDREILNKKLNEILNENLSFEVDFFSTLSEEEKTKLYVSIVNRLCNNLDIKNSFNNNFYYHKLKNLIKNLNEEEKNHLINKLKDFLKNK